MTIKIRLARNGSKKNPHYRIIIANCNSPRDGKFLDKVGAYNPMLSKNDKKRITLLEKKINYWLSVGAKPTLRVKKLLNLQNKNVDKKNTS